MELIIEVDGEIHQRRIESDNLREEILASRDLFILRFSNKEINNNLESVLKELQEFVCHGCKHKNYMYPPSL